MRDLRLMDPALAAYDSQFAQILVSRIPQIQQLPVAGCDMSVHFLTPDL